MGHSFEEICNNETGDSVAVKTGKGVKGSYLV